MVTTGGALAAQLAVTGFVAASSVTLHVSVPEQPLPDQPAKVWLESGVAVSVTGDCVKVTVQLERQLMPAGDDVTVPPPALVSAICAVPVPARDAGALPPGVAETVSD